MFSETIIHPLEYSGELPECFNNPLFYTPHEICIVAVADMLPHVRALMSDVGEGKMFGVLVVENVKDNAIATKELFYLAAFSGQIHDQSVIPGFVPPIFDILEPNGYFKTHEAEISAINRRIALAEKDNRYVESVINLEKLRKQANIEIEESKNNIIASKKNRDLIRKEGVITAQKSEELIRESQFLKAEHKRLCRRWEEKLLNAEKYVQEYQCFIERLKAERKNLSEKLQNWIFSQYKLLNYDGRCEDITGIFTKSVGTLPPSGTGDCCEPKLLQYAYKNNLKPIQMAMFWWGDSPKTEIRHHLKYYPACSGKCKPLLEYMLPGDVFKNEKTLLAPGLEIVYEDDDLWAVKKPSGLQSVPGKTQAESVYSLLKAQFPDIEPLIVHRLDMDTSGLMLVAKNKDSHYILQRQFENHEIRKTYYAELSGYPLPVGLEGEISLSLSADPLNRPFQIVDYENGKKAVTRFRALSEHLVELQPLTGRTHQLRVHCAHPQGLGRPILGDNLYGNSDGILQLFAAKIIFTHPTTGKRVELRAKS